MESKIKKLKITKNSPSKMSSKFPNIEKLSPIKGYTFQNKIAINNEAIKKNISMDSFFDSSNPIKVKLRNKKNFFDNFNSKKNNNTGDLSIIKINKSNNGLFSSYSKLKNQSAKNKYKITGKIKLFTGKNKTVFRKILESIDKIRKENQKTNEEIKKNEKKTISLKLKTYCDWKKIKIKPETQKMKTKKIINMKPIKKELIIKRNKNIDEEIKSILPETTNNLSVSIKKDLNFLNSNNNENNKNIENLTKTFFRTNMYHTRNLSFTKEQIENSFNKAGIITKICKKPAFIKGIEMQMNDIYNKIKLIIENINYFKANYFNNGNFYSAFNIMKNISKAELNLSLEELCFILIDIIPKLLQKFFNNLEQVLYIQMPNIEEEMEKRPKNEKECLEYNCSFLKEVTLYFTACVEVLKEVQKRIEFFKYTDNEYILIDNYLDLARFNIIKINSMAESYIDKMKKDKQILEKIEMGLGNRKKKITHAEDIFERTHKRYTQNFREEMKLERINSTLNIRNNSFLKDEKRIKYILMQRTKKLNILNQPVVSAMMKYFKDNIKSQIISQRVFERYQSKEKQSQNMALSKND